MQYHPLINLKNDSGIKYYQTITITTNNKTYHSYHTHSITTTLIHHHMHTQFGRSFITLNYPKSSHNIKPLYSSTYIFYPNLKIKGHYTYLTFKDKHIIHM